MSWDSKVLWTEGLFLQPHHFQQADRYAETETVKRGIGTTRLHKIVVVYKGMEMRVCEEIG